LSLPPNTTPLLKDPPGGKYRPHIAGTGKPLFRCDLYDPNITGPVLLVEGEIKAMVTYSRLQDIREVSYLRRVTVIGTAGKQLKEEYVPEFSQAEEIYICLDPDAREQAERAARLLGVGRCRVIDLPGKIDDLLLCGALQVSDLLGLMQAARKVR